MFYLYHFLIQFRWNMCPHSVEWADSPKSLLQSVQENNPSKNNNKKELINLNSIIYIQNYVYHSNELI